GIIAALKDAVTNGLNLGGLTPDQWVHAQPSHLCAKIVVREQGTSFPNLGLTPDQDARLAQKNLAPFDINLTATDPAPNINWKNFIVGQPIFLKLKDAGANELTLTKQLRQEGFELYIAIPKATFDGVFRKGGDISKVLRKCRTTSYANGTCGSVRSRFRKQWSCEVPRSIPLSEFPPWTQGNISGCHSASSTT